MEPRVPNSRVTAQFTLGGQVWGHQFSCHLKIMERDREKIKIGRQELRRRERAVKPGISTPVPKSHERDGQHDSPAVVRQALRGRGQVYLEPLPPRCLPL